LRFQYDMATGALTLVEDHVRPARPPRWAQVSPDQQTVVFARNHNLYMMDAANYAKAQKNANDSSIVETKLTDDGEEHYSFARTVMAGADQQQQQQQDETEQQEDTDTTANKNARVAAVQVAWSRDSKRFTAVRRDVRKVKDLWVINSLSNPRPTLETYRYAMPGEENVPLSELYVFEVVTKKRTQMKIDRFKDQTISVATAPETEKEREEGRQLSVGNQQGQGQGGGGQGGPGAGANIPARWLSASPDKIYVTRLSRDMHRMDVCVADATTGEVKTLIEERLNTYIETKPLRLVNDGHDLVEWSERDGWGHYYLYDAATGTLKNRITQGEFVTLAIDGVDDKTKTLFISAVGHEKGEDPYYPHLYRVNYDGTGLKLLDPGDASHAVAVDDDVHYFIDNSSRVDSVPEAVLYDTLGNVVTKLESPDLGALKEAGFKFPEPFKVKADDGVTDLYGVMYKPFDFDATKKYPVIEYVYPGPQTESVTKTFNPRETSMSLAQYGFIVVEVGNRGGNPQRSKWYHNYGYGNLRDYGLADKKATIEQLAQRYSYIDSNRVGIWGHSGGGFMTAAALLVYPDFFKVGWSESGNHENNIYNNTWSEKNHGIKEIDAEDGSVTFEYNIEKNSDLAKNLKGHLMLVTGDIDNNVHPANTFRLANALIKANKRFDFMILPGMRHPYTGDAAYVNQRRAEYFCRYLLGKTEDDADMVELDREQQQTGDKGKVP
ncbi:MAG: DPP IV N-terminal domain-containing protein, partial [Vicinamibacterales bacterium]